MASELPILSRAFSAVSLIDSHEAAARTPEGDISFVKQSLAIQRSASAKSLHSLVLASSISVRSSNSAYDTPRSSPSRAASSTPPNVIEEEISVRPTHTRNESTSSNGDNLSTSACTLRRHGSTATQRSTRSVRSVRGIGVIPVGSLRVHSPSPTRPVTADVEKYLKDGDLVIIRDIPVGSLICCDMGTFVTPHIGMLEGFKDVPTGVHLLWGGSMEHNSRVGFWFMTSKKASDELGEVFVRRWDKDIGVPAMELSQAEVHNQKTSVAEINDKLWSHGVLDKIDQLAGLAKVTFELWDRLTSSIKGSLLTKVTGKGWNKWEVATEHEYRHRSTAEGPDRFHHRKEEVLNFVVPRNSSTVILTSSNRERADSIMDASDHVISIITKNCSYEDSDELIGELQFCFIMAVYLGNKSCAEQWVIIVKLVLRAFNLVLEMPDFMSKFIRALHAQLFCDEECLMSSIMDHELTTSREFKQLIITFKARLNSSLLKAGPDLTDEQANVGKTFEAMESYLWKWGWDLRSNYVKARTLSSTQSSQSGQSGNLRERTGSFN